MPQAVNPPVMYYQGTPYGLGGVTMVDKHSVMTMLYSRETGDSEDVITLSEDFDHFDLLIISGRAYINDGLWHQSNAYICDSLAVGNRVSIGDDGSISWFDIYDKTTLSRAHNAGNPYQITHVMGVKFNGTTAGGGGGSTIELVDIFNGASDITPTYTNGVTVTTSSVTSNVGAMSCSEWSNGYEGFNIALSNLTVGEVYTLNFDFQFTNADYFAYNAYRTGFQLFAVDNRNYELYNTWPANLHRDNGLHNHKKKFTATASTMYLSFNLCGCSDNRTNYFEITNLYVQTTNASEDIGYSTDEQVIGTWIDGKPLYQKTIEIKVTTDGVDFQTAYQHNIANVDNIWLDPSGSFIYMPSWGYQFLNFLSTGVNTNGGFENSYLRFLQIVDRSYIYYRHGEHETGETLYVTLRYTKTTD